MSDVGSVDVNVVCHGFVNHEFRLQGPWDDTGGLVSGLGI